MEDEESRQRHVISVAQTIAMQAMELPRDQRARFIERAVTAIRRDFDRKYGADQTPPMQPIGSRGSLRNSSG